MQRVSLLLALLAIPAFADEKAKPNTLTPKEIAGGWISIFDGETTFGWKVDGRGESGGRRSYSRRRKEDEARLNIANLRFFQIRL